jgi:hypothetical protein
MRGLDRFLLVHVDEDSITGGRASRGKIAEYPPVTVARASPRMIRQSEYPTGKGWKERR